jgi:hypothetical protein
MLEEEIFQVIHRYVILTINEGLENIFRLSCYPRNLNLPPELFLPFLYIPV